MVLRHSDVRIPCEAARESSRIDDFPVLAYVVDGQPEGIELQRVVLREASLRHSRLWSATLEKANLREADLRFAYLVEVRLAGQTCGMPTFSEHNCNTRAGRQSI